MFIHNSHRRHGPRRFFLVAGGLGLLGLLVFAGARPVCSAQQPANEDKSSRSFDLREVTKYRPVFTTTYFGGFQGTTDKHVNGKNISTQVEGVTDWSEDFRRIKYYLDPLITHALFGLREAWPRFEWPDLLKNDPAEIEAWKLEVSSQLPSLFKTYHENQFQMILNQGFFVNCGASSAPEWYERVPDWSELTPDGKVPDISTNDGRGKGKGIASLAHPELYRVFARDVALLKELGLDREKAVVSFQPENEPGIELRDFGGNSHTVALFRAYLQREDGDITGFNRVAGTNYRSFDEVDIAHSSPVMDAWADRFRAWLVSHYYQGKMGDISRREVPHWNLTTRFQTFDATGARGDISYLQDTTTDYAGISFYPDAYINKEGRAVRNRMGMLAVLGSQLAAHGRPVALTEFGINKGIAPSNVLTQHMLPYELTNLLYRSLAYNVRLIGLFWYEPPVHYSWAYVYGMNLSRFPDTLRAFRQVRDEFERIRPYETFGTAYPNELAVLVSRNAIHYPGAGDLYYDGLQKKLRYALDDPELSQYDLLEEHTSRLEERLSGYKGIAVVDACLRNETRDVLARMARRGIRVLALGAPQYLDQRFRPAGTPASYPIARVGGGPVVQNSDRKPAMVSGTEHPILGGRRQWELAQAVPVEPRHGAQVLLRQEGSEKSLGYVNDKVAYLSGLPTSQDEWRDLLLGFARWAGATVRPVVVSQFENAVVVQNYSPEAEDLRQGIVTEKVWRGSLSPRNGVWKGQLREARADIPWLAYSRQGDTFKVEGLRLDAMGVQVIQKREGKELPHFEGTPEDMGFLDFKLGWDHVVGKFEVAEAGEKLLRYAAGMWDQAPVHWQVNEVDSPSAVADGDPPVIRFRAQPGKQYYLTIRRTEKHDPNCPLCSQGRMQ